MTDQRAKKQRREPKWQIALIFGLFLILIGLGAEIGPQSPYFRIIVAAFAAGILALIRELIRLGYRAATGRGKSS